MAVTAALGMTGTSYGQDEPTFERPRYQTVRYAEDWSVLANVDRTSSGDIFDPIKYMPLTEDGDIWASFGGQVRLRAEGWNNFNFGAPPDVKHDDTFLLSRFRLHGDLHVGDHVRIFAEGISAWSTDRDLVGGRRTMDVDSVDLLNAFIDLTAPLSDDVTFVFRAGRQELLLGRQRLVSPLDWANTRRTLDGFAGVFVVHDWTVTAFWAQLVEVRKYNFNRSDAQVEVFGVYAAGRVPNTDIGLDLYWIGLDLDNPVTYVNITGDEDRHTLGFRLHGKCGTTGFDYDIEAAYQFGEVGSTDISAFMIGSQLGYTVQCAWSPRFFVGFDYATGGADNDEVNTFNQLLPLGHAYLGWIDVVGRQNIMAFSAGVSVKPIERLTLHVQGFTFHRADRGDALYNAGAGVVRGGDLADDREIGYELDLMATYQVDAHLELMLGYSHFFTGDFVENSGPSSDIDFVYMGATWTF